MAECVGSAFDLCDGFAIRLPALNPSEWKPKSAIYSAVSAYPVIRPEFQDVRYAPFLEGVWVVVCES